MNLFIGLFTLFSINAFIPSAINSEISDFIDEIEIDEDVLLKFGGLNNGI